MCFNKSSPLVKSKNWKKKKTLHQKKIWFFFFILEKLWNFAGELNTGKTSLFSPFFGKLVKISH